MDTTVVTPPADPITPDPAPSSDSSGTSESIADHAATFGREARLRARQAPADPIDDDESPSDGGGDRARDEQGRFERQRAKSHRASPEDVPRIRELTKKWRTEEAERKALAEKYAQLEQEIATLKAPKPMEPPAAPAPFSATKPAFETYANEPDPLAAYTEALAVHATKQTTAEAERAKYEAAQAAYQQAAQAREAEATRALIQQYHARLGAYVQVKPDFEAVIKAGPSEDLTPILRTALLTDDRGPEFVYTLAQRPDLLAEVLLLSEGRAVTESSVAAMRRVLASRIPGASTGSPGSAGPVYQPPKPPNPVRPGPTRRGDELPGDDASLAEHERAFGPKRRR